MVHGLATNLAFWYPLAPCFTDAHQVTLYDLRGHGRSSMPETGYTPEVMAEDLRELLDHLGIEAAHLMAHSFGGSVVLHFACTYPERVLSLILVDVRLRLFQPKQRLRDSPRGVRLRRTLEKIGVLLDEDDPEAGYQILEAIARLQLRTPPGQFTRRHQRILSRLLPKGSQRTSARWLKLLETTTARADFINGESLTLEQLKQLKHPIIGVYGEYSPTLPTAFALKDIWPDRHFEVIPQAGHFFPVSQPKKLIASARSFLNPLN